MTAEPKPTDSPRQSALLRLLKACSTLPAQALFYGLALGVVAAMLPPGLTPAELATFWATLPPGLQLVVPGVAINTLSAILQRVAQSAGQVSDDEIRAQVLSAIDESQIADLLTAEEFQREIGRVLREQHLIRAAIEHGEYAIVDHLAQQIGEHRALLDDIREDLLAEMQTLATKEQAEQILAQLQHVLALLSPSLLALSAKLDDANATLDRLAANSATHADIETLHASLVTAAAERLVAERYPRSLHQLPSPPADFTGREKELAELRKAVLEGGVTIVGARGMGGIGKTALALKLAEELTPGYPDAQIYLDLKGTSSQPLSPEDAMLHVIRAYQPEAKLPPTEAELAGLYRTVLAGQHALLLMDNARDKAQVEPLIPPRGNLLLVTSRWHFTVPGLKALNLGILTPDDARGLLLKIAPCTPDEADTIAKACGYLALALRLAGSALAECENLSPAEYIRRCQQAGARLELVDAPLSLSYGLLTHEQQVRWCALAVFVGSFDCAAAATVWAIEQEPARQALSELVKHSLVEYDRASGRYALHDLARDWAGARLDEQERETAERRHAAYFAFLGRVAEYLYRMGADKILQGLALFDLERSNMEAGQAWAATRAGKDDGAAELAIGYAMPQSVLGLRLPPRLTIAWLKTALDSAKRLGKREAESAHLNNLGLAYVAVGECRRAIECYEQAIVIAGETGQRQSAGNYLGNLGTAFARLGRPQRAIEYLGLALTIHRETRNRQAEGTTLGNLGLAYATLGQTRHAIECFEKALDIARDTGDRQGEANQLGNLGLVFTNPSKAQHAIECLEQALAIHCALGDRQGEANQLGNLGAAYHVLGDLRRAIEYHELALAIVRDIGDRRGEGHHLGHLGVAYFHLGETPRAVKYCEQALAVALETGDRQAEESHLCNLGNAYVTLGEWRPAAGCYERALAIAREVGDQQGEGITLYNVACVYYRLGDVASAIRHAEKSRAILVRLEAPQAMQVCEVLAKWRAEQQAAEKPGPSGDTG